MLIDTNIFIDLLRKYPPAIEAFRSLLYDQKSSIITKFELIVGSRDKRQLNYILKNLESFNIEFIPITPEISIKAESILQDYNLSKGITIEDSLIAATALVNNEELVTRNIKHFDFIPNLKILKPY